MRARRRAGAILRVVLTVAMLAVLITRVQVTSLVPRWNIGTVSLLLGAIGTALVGITLASLRWQRVPSALDLPHRMTKLLPTDLASLFISDFLPTTIGGDVLRVRRVSSLVLERLTGWVVLPIITLAAQAINLLVSLLGAPAFASGMRRTSAARATAA